MYKMVTYCVIMICWITLGKAIHMQEMLISQVSICVEDFFPLEITINIINIVSKEKLGVP